MMLFGTGLGAEGDVYACCTVLAGLYATVGTAVVGLTRRSVGATVTSMMLAGFVGTVVVYGAATHELHDTEDSREVHAMGWQFVWWWAASLCAPLAAGVHVLGGPRLRSLLNRTVAAVTRAFSGPKPQQPGQEGEGILLRVTWLLILSWAILLVILFAR